jgi:hypothetical protein
MDWKLGKIIVAGLVLALSVGIAIGGELSARAKSVTILGAHAKMQAMMFRMALDSGETGKAFAHAEEGSAHLEAQLPKALAAAKGRPNVEAAAKAAYLAGKAFFREAGTGGGDIVDRAKMEALMLRLSNANDALMLEVETSGL